MFVVDSNVLLHAVNAASPHHVTAKALLSDRLGGVRPIFLTWGIAYEFLRVATHRAVFPRPMTLADAIDFLHLLIDNPRVEVLAETPAHVTLLREAANRMPSLSGSVLHDLHTALLMREWGVTDIVTEDADFHKFEGIRPENPFLKA